MLLLKKKEFFSGILLAVVSVVALLNISSIYATTGRTIPEVEFSQRLGLFDSSRLTPKVLSSNISELAFQRALNIVLVKAGITKRFNMAELVELGIIRDGASNGSISRQGAAKTLMRAIIHGWYQEVLHRDGVKNVNPFKDWYVEPRYNEALSYAVQHNIFRGCITGNFRPNRKLKVREALAFLQRLYEDAIGAAKIEPVPQKVDTTRMELLCREDETVFAEQFERLKNIGAFDLTTLGGKIRGDSAISTEDITLLFVGILQRINEPAFITQVKYYGHTSEETYANRDILACMGNSLVNAIPHEIFDSSKIVYSDVSPLCEVDYALNNLAKAGIRMGYTDSKFKGYERVSIYEVFGLIDKILRDLTPKASVRDQALSSADIEAWKRQLIRRKNRIRRILEN